MNHLPTRKSLRVILRIVRAVPGGVGIRVRATKAIAGAARMGSKRATPGLAPHASPKECGPGFARWLCDPDGVVVSVMLMDRNGASVARLDGAWPEMGDLAHVAFLE